MCVEQQPVAWSARGGKADPWRGVNLGGWLLLEPGTAKALFSRHAQDGVEALCEWDLMLALKQKNALGDIWKHRDTYITKRDFQRIRSYGLNAVRLPFGYWVVVGAATGEPFVGPALQYIDRALEWAEECGLQVVLDLHGCPGGESAEAPCGRRQRPLGCWDWQDWRFEETLRALEVVAKRYCNSKVVTGIEVCNEPSPAVPTPALCDFYNRAVSVVRSAGMRHDRVAVVLPLFQRPADEVLQEWNHVSADRHQNVCFDLHYYHCFENEWNGKTMAQQLRSVQEHAQELRRFPAVVGEWSLALGLAAQQRCLLDEEARALFCRTQLAAYSEASHGWFFWNWTDAHGTEWDWQRSYQEGSMTGPQTCLPSWDGTGDDPLEEDLDPSPADPFVVIGDSIFLRAFHGRHVDMGGSQACARWADRGEWQRFVVCLPSGKSTKVRLGKRRKKTNVADGDLICLRAHNGHLVSVKGGKVVKCPEDAVDESADFIVHVQGGGPLRHRSTVFLQSRCTSCLLDVDGSGLDTDVHARWDHFGEWQRFVVEKAQKAKAHTQPAPALSRKRRRSSCSPVPREPAAQQQEQPRQQQQQQQQQQQMPGTPPRRPRRSSVATPTPPQRKRLSQRPSFAPTPEKATRRRSSVSGTRRRSSVSGPAEPKAAGSPAPGKRRCSGRHVRSL